MGIGETFTIGVARPRSAGFTFGDLALFHEECGGGGITQSEASGSWELKCARCSRYVHLSPSNASTGAIVRTAADGVKRTVKVEYAEVFVILVDRDAVPVQEVELRNIQATRFRVALRGGSTVDILAERYSPGGYSGDLWEFYSGKTVVATFDMRSVGAIVRVDHIADGTDVTLGSEDHERAIDAMTQDESNDG